MNPQAPAPQGLRSLMAARAAREVQPNHVVNLGIGLPTLVANHLSPDDNVWIHSENGILGAGGAPPAGEEDPHLINAGGMPVTAWAGVSYFDSATAFGMIRGGHVDLAVLGALQVSATGDLANWIVPGKRVAGVGGGMELAGKARRVVVLCEHTDRQGLPKIVAQCELPLTAPACVHRIITDLAVFDLDETGLVLKELAAHTSLASVTAKTGATFRTVDNPDILYQEFERP